MTDMLRVRPAPGRRVLHPVTQQPLGEAWVRLPRDTWLIRRLADGDLEQRPVEPATAHSARKEG
jgi:hypothetical protein